MRLAYLAYYGGPRETHRIPEDKLRRQLLSYILGRKKPKAIISLDMQEWGSKDFGGNFQIYSRRYTNRNKICREIVPTMTRPVGTREPIERASVGGKTTIYGSYYKRNGSMPNEAIPEHPTKGNRQRIQSERLQTP